MALLSLITGFSLQAAFVNVYYSYGIWIVFILQNQFSSLKHSDEFVLTLICTLVYNILMLPGPFATCCSEPSPYNGSAPCTEYWKEWCAHKSVDPVRYLLFSLPESNVTVGPAATVTGGLSYVSESNLLFKAIQSSWSPQVFVGSWLLDFNLDRLIPVLLVVIVCGQSTSRRARRLFLHKQHVARQHQMIEKTTRGHEDLLTLPRQLWFMDNHNVNKVIDSYGSVLFADIVSFTVFSTTLAQAPMELVLVLNEMFQQFDKAAVSVSFKALVFCHSFFWRGGEGEFF